MCGIYGFIGQPKNKSRIYKIVRAMAISTESRGRHSAGFVAMNDDSYFLDKSAVTATRFFEEVDVKDVIDSGVYLFLGHNRWASVGDITDVNAHPFEGDKYFLAHNGTCPAAPRLVNMLGMETTGTTDSESLLVLAERFGRGIFRRFTDLSVVTVKKTGEGPFVDFYRDSYKPMVICDLRETLGVVLFASTRTIIEDGLRGAAAGKDLMKATKAKAFSTPVRQHVAFNRDGKMFLQKKRRSTVFDGVVTRFLANKSARPRTHVS